MLLIDKLSYCSGLKDYSPSLKAFIAFTTLLICVTSRSIGIASIVILLFSFITINIGKTPWLLYLRLLMIPSGFLIFSIVGVIFSFSFHSSTESLFSFRCFTLYITATKASSELGFRLFASALAALTCLYFLSLSTPVMEILMVLRQLKCPYILLELMLLIYRFLFLMLDMGNHLTLSAEARLGNRSIKSAISSMGQIFSSLFVHSLKKASRLYDSMEARCYDGTLPFLTASKKASKLQLLSAVCFELTLIALALILK